MFFERKIIIHTLGKPHANLKNTGFAQGNVCIVTTRLLQFLLYTLVQLLLSPRQWHQVCLPSEPHLTANPTLGIPQTNNVQLMYYKHSYFLTCSMITGRAKATTEQRRGHSS